MENRFVARLLILVASVMTLLGAADSAAQGNGSGFNGRWIRVFPAGVEPTAALSSVLTVTLTDQLLTVEERSGDGYLRSLKRYPWDPTWTPGSPASPPGRAFT